MAAPAVVEPVEQPVTALTLLPMGEDLLAGLPPPFSIEIDERTDPMQALALRFDALNDVGTPQQVDTDPLIKRAMEILYGSDFPLLDREADDGKWADWAESLWARHTSGIESRLHLVERNRFFRKSMQWVSAQGLGVWREPLKPRDAARAVHNVLRPALDQRVQLIAEQRPGFRTRPATHDPADLKKAEAQQYALEYQWDQQQMARVIAEMAYWAGTDGVCFLELQWDPERGPWHEAFDIEPVSGMPIPMGPDGQPSIGPDGQPGQPHKFPLGDVRPQVRRIEHVRVSAEATANRKPWYTVIKETIPAAQAIREYGPEVLGARGEGETSTSRMGERVGLLGSMPSQRLGYMIPEPNELHLGQETLDRITVYCEPSEYMKEGLHLVVVGQKRIYQSGLLWGVVPMLRMTDGSTDPSYFPEPIMDGWVDTQMRINAVISKWIENVRLNAGPRIISKANSLVGETFVGGTMSNIEVKGLGSVADSVRPLQGFSLAGDALELFNLEMKTFEDLSGWNQVSRGQFSSEQSGKAILAIRESLERVFAPPIQAAADFATDWSKVTLAGLHWGYDIPRTIGMLGSGRPDLGRALASDDFDGVADVWVDPETLMPMPRALKLVLLKEMRQMGDMGPTEYRRRMPFSYIGQMGSPDEDQDARANRCVEALKSGAWPQILWQDNESIHQDALERQLILPDDTDPMIRQQALMRWDMLGQQALLKMQAMNGMMPMLNPGEESAQPPSPNGSGQQAGGDSTPSLEGGSPVLQYGGTGPNAQSKEFDARSPR